MRATDATHLWVKLIEKLKDSLPVLFGLTEMTGTFVCIYAIVNLGLIAKFLAQSIV